MKKIMIIVPELYHGGAEKQFRAIISGLNKQGYEVIVVDEHLYGNDDPALCKKFIEQNKGVNHIELKRRNHKRIIKYIMINKEMLSILMKNKPDLVFSASLKLARLCKILKIPFIYSERNAAEGKEYYREKSNALKSSTRITCNSVSAQNEMKAHGFTAQYIANGIEECGILERTYNSSIVLVPARISADKNQTVMVDALRFLPNEVRVVFVGKVSEQEYLNSVVNRINDLNLEDRVEIVPFTNDIKELYKKAAVVVLPSLTEGLSNVILESYMYGRICILSDIPQNRNAASANQRFFDPSSPELLADEITKVFNLNNSEYENECKHNHDYVIEVYGMNRMVDEYRKVFDDVLFH